MGSFSYNQETQISLDIKALTEVKEKAGMQVATVRFEFTEQEMGEVVLNPTKTTYSDITLNLDKMTLHIASIRFNAATNMRDGKVSATGWFKTDDDKEETAFAKTLGRWEHAPCGTKAGC